MPQAHLTTVRFDSFQLDPRILAGLADAGFIYCTPIQAAALPIALAGADVAGQAQTGTGKTAAFLVAALHRLLGPPQGADAPAPDRPGQPRVLILAPTRELAVQIHRDAEVLAAHTGLRATVVYGGTGYQDQRDQLAAGVDILIGTPGRLIDYHKQRVFDLSHVEVAVLDEADRMFDLGFIKDIRYVLRRLPPPERRLGMLFSATLSYRVTELAYEHMNQPRMVEIEPERITAERVRQRCYLVGNDEKIPLLIGLLRSLTDARVMIFVNTKRQGERVWGYLEGNGLHAAMLSGDVPQPKRLRLLQRFQAGELPIMVATDVAARGLHIPAVTHVINYDLPEEAEDYVHRIGRTARAGAFGEAISFACETYAFSLPAIEQFISARIEVCPHDDALLATIDAGSRIPAPRRPRDERRGAPPARGRRDGRDGGSRDRPRPQQRAASDAAPVHAGTVAAVGDASSNPQTANPQTANSQTANSQTANSQTANPQTDGPTRKRRRRPRRKPAAVTPAPDA